jgi:hypothetical protein
MTINIEIASNRIARDVRAAEDALTEALIRQSSLFTTLVRVRRDAGVEAFTGQDALLRLAHSQQALLNSGSDLARVHGKLRDIAMWKFRRRSQPNR